MEVSGPSPSEEDAWEAMLKRPSIAEQAGPTDPEMMAETLRRYKRGECLPSANLPTFGGSLRLKGVFCWGGVVFVHSCAPPEGVTQA